MEHHPKQRRSLRPVAFAAVVFSTVRYVISFPPLILSHYLQPGSMSRYVPHDSPLRADTRKLHSDGSRLLSGKTFLYQFILLISPPLTRKRHLILHRI